MVSNPHDDRGKGDGEGKGDGAEDLEGKGKIANRDKDKAHNTDSSNAGKPAGVKGFIGKVKGKVAGVWNVLVNDGDMQPIEKTSL
jgi:hypothetical protein